MTVFGYDQESWEAEKQGPVAETTEGDEEEAPTPSSAPVDVEQAEQEQVTVSTPEATTAAGGRENESLVEEDTEEEEEVPVAIFEPTAAPVQEETMEEQTPEPTEEANISRPPYDPANTVRIVFAVQYTIDSENSVDPSQQEQDNLDDALVSLYSDALNQISNIDSYWVTSSLQEPTSTGWEQNIVVEFTFANELPPQQSIVDAIVDNVETSSFLISSVKSLGPTFADATSWSFDFDIEQYSDSN